MEVTLIDHMGDDLRVVNAARVSFHKESEWEWDEPANADWEHQEEPSLSEADQKLIKYLAKHNHWTPFSHVIITLREKVPLFVARQRFKHMVGFSYNEISRRYVDGPPEFYTPIGWRKRAENVKQGSSDEVVKPNDVIVFSKGYSAFLIDYPTYLQIAEDLYTSMINDGVAPEEARMVLPQSMYTEYYCTGSLSAWARAYTLRSDSHAQYEIRLLADKWNQIISNIKELEHSWKALTN